LVKESKKEVKERKIQKGKEKKGKEKERKVKKSRGKKSKSDYDSYLKSIMVVIRKLKTFG